MIRVALLTLFCTFLTVFAWRDWFKALCGLILLMAVVEHPDMPKSLAGIQGLNPWNIVLFSVVCAWRVQRKKEGLTWDMPRGINWLLILYLVVTLVSTARLLADYHGVLEFTIAKETDPPTVGSMVSEFLINTVKWVFPGLMLYDGCRDRTRLKWAVAAVLLVYVGLAIQVIKWMPLANISNGADLAARSLKILMREVGYHRVNIAVILAGGGWAIFAARVLVDKTWQVWMMTLASVMVAFALALTGGRAGYATWAAVGAILALIRWRKYLILGPILGMVVLSAVPAVRERMLNGFTAESQDTNGRLDPSMQNVQIQGGKADAYTVTAGRNIAWPFVIHAIGKAPFFGYGREAMQNTGIATRLFVDYGEDFPHPHNAYLQWLLDNGWIGAIPVFLFYLIIMKRSISLFYDSRSTIFIAVGGICLSLTAAVLIGALGSQTFYPREGAVGMWCGIGLMFRVYVERARIAEQFAEARRERSVGAWERWLWPLKAPGQVTGQWAKA
jgi:O-antigen ligase